ncbi:hypothetical protein C8Q74DRAFT_1299218 [Fomes fomentarius]|nr:hypothetical protein C8Q74DRAFT_1299218 [Fomes fomentarius]
MSNVIRMSTSRPADYRLLVILISTANCLGVACPAALRPQPYTFLSNLSCTSLVDSPFCFMLSQLIPGTVHSALRFHICFHTLSDHTHGARTSSPARAVSMPVYTFARCIRPDISCLYYYTFILPMSRCTTWSCFGWGSATGIPHFTVHAL